MNQPLKELIHEKPIRIQLKRTKGWRKPNGAINCTRPGKWGNPFIIGVTPFCTTAEDAKYMYRGWIDSGLPGAPTSDNIKKELAGHNLMCYCQLNQNCHADILLEIANQ